MSNHHTLPNIQYCRCGLRITGIIGKAEVGQWCVCAGCGRISIFDLHLNLRIPSVADYMSMPLEMKASISTIRETIRQQYMTSDEIVAEIDRYFDDGDKANFGEPDAEEVGERWDGLS